LLLTAAQAADRLGIRESQFRRAVKRGELPQPFLTCRPYRWLKSELIARPEGSSVERDALAERIREYNHEIR